MAVIKMRMRAADVPEVLRNERDVTVGDDAAKGQSAVQCKADRVSLAEGFVLFHSADLSRVILAMSRETVVYVAAGEGEAVCFSKPDVQPTPPTPPAPPKGGSKTPRKNPLPDED